ADVDDLGLFEAPLAQDAKALAVPIGIDDQVDRQMDPKRAGKFERLEIAAQRHALAVLEEALLVDRFEAEEHVGEAEPLPEAKHLLVAQQHVAAGVQVIALADAGAGDRLAELHAVPLVDERNIADDKDAGLEDPADTLHHPLRACEAE